MSAGGNTCGEAMDEACDPDECYGRDECPGHGYWCKDAGIAKVISIAPENLLFFYLDTMPMTLM